MSAAAPEGAAGAIFFGAGWLFLMNGRTLPTYKKPGPVFSVPVEE